MVKGIFGANNNNNKNNFGLTSLTTAQQTPNSIFGWTPTPLKKQDDEIAKRMEAEQAAKKQAKTMVSSALSRAKGQVGVKEATNHNDGGAIAKYRAGESKDGKTPVNNYAPYCASFISWCYGNKAPFGYEKYTPSLKSDAVKAGMFTNKSKIGTGAKGTYRPQNGDLMMWINANGKGGHVAMIERTEIKNGQLVIHTIEGNNKKDGEAETATTKATGTGQEGVVRRTYTMDDIKSTGRIKGVIRMTDWIEQAEYNKRIK